LERPLLIDGEAVLLGVDGISDFDGLHSRRHDEEVQFYAFDILVSDGEDNRKLPLNMRKANLFLTSFLPSEPSPACQISSSPFSSRWQSSWPRSVDPRPGTRSETFSFDAWTKVAPSERPRRSAISAAGRLAARLLIKSFSNVVQRRARRRGISTVPI
jgi:hypothetical protein